MSFEGRLEECAGAVGARLERAMRDLPFSRVALAMRYAAEGGKRLRGFLVMESARLHGLDDADSVTAAAAIEAIHAYSLVHDDLPAMDDDAMRRGRPTVHVAWDEATAVLTGDALQTLAFELLAEAHPDPAVCLTLIRTMARAAGAEGMVLGQARDIAAETAPLPLGLAEITALQAGKTGALIRWSAAAGARLARADPAPLEIYAEALGLAFQIADDLLDATGDPAVIGKRIGKDADAGKATFVSLLGVEGARTRAQSLVTEAEAALDPYGPAALNLRAAARFAIERHA